MERTIDGGELTEELLDAIEAYSRAANVHRKSTEYRYCSSDNFDGVEIRFYGGYIPVRAIIEYIREKEDVRIESIGHVTDEYEPNLTVFIADLPRFKDSEAFIG